MQHVEQNIVHNNNTNECYRASTGDTKNYHYITTDFKKWKSKPTDGIGIIHHNMVNVAHLTINEFAQFVAQPFGATFSPARYNGKRCNANFISQSIFLLDFDDSNISMDGVIDRMSTYGITPNMYYTTFSDKPEHRKFRFAFFLDTIITEPSERNAINRSLLKLFPEADQSCKDAARMFFGGLTSKVITTEPVKYKQLYDVLNINNIDSKSGNISRSIIKSNNLLKNGKAIYNNIAFPSSHTISPTQPSWEEAIASIRILNDFANIKWLSHLELYGLATNLIHVKGKKKWMKEIMEVFNQRNKGVFVDSKEKQYTDNNFKLLSYLPKMKYHPQWLKEFSPYEEDHSFRTIYAQLATPRGQVEVITPQQKVTLQKAELELNHAFHEAIESSGNETHLIKVVTGIGKTELLTTLDKNVLIALPTHRLKDELQQRRVKRTMVTPELPEFSNELINTKIAHYYAIGAENKVHGILNALARNARPEDINTDSQLASEYLERMYESYACKDMLLTTHQKAIYHDFKHHDTIIFDEDPLSSLLKINTMCLSDLFKFSLMNCELSTVFDTINGCSVNQYVETPTFNIDTEKLIESMIEDGSASSNIIDFLRSSYFIRDEKNKDLVHYIIRTDLPENKKIIIMSATIPCELYRKLYGDRVVVTDISNVEQVGKVIQHTKRSYSKNSLKSNHKDVVASVSDLPVITHADLKYLFTQATEGIHFRNCEGYDELNGLDIAVVGTPHLPTYVYFLYALVCGVEIKTTDNIKFNRTIEWKGFRFSFTTFENKELRDIQLALIESELIQACGRNRTLRKDATTYLYSNLPLHIATEIKRK